MGVRPTPRWDGKKSRWGVFTEIIHNWVRGLSPRCVSSSLRYVASRSDAASFGTQWFALAAGSGIYQDETETEEVVVIGDGAAWIWNLSEQYFPGAVEIVDYMHAKSHLYDIAKQAYGETSPGHRIQDWVEVRSQRRSFMLAIPKKSGSISEPWELEIPHFQRR